MEHIEYLWTSHTGRQNTQSDWRQASIAATRWPDTGQLILTGYRRPSRCAYCKRVWVETDRTCPGCGAPTEE